MGWLAGYYYRVPITIVNTNRSAETLTAFPVNVMFAANTAIGALVTPAGTDWRFTAADGTTLLNFERVSHVVTAGALTAEFWVAATLDKDTNQVTIYGYFGKANQTDGSSTSAWLSSYKSVVHFGTASSLLLTDSLAGMTLSSADATAGSGVISGAVSLNGSSAYVAAPKQSWLDFGTGDFSISLWVNCTSYPTTYSTTLVSLGYGANGAPPYYYTGWSVLLTSSGTLLFYRYDGSEVAITIKATAIGTGGWHHVLVSRDSGTLTVTVDGTQTYSAANSTSYNSVNTDNLIFGRFISGTGPQTKYLNGSIDEVRIASGSGSSRSTNWAKFEWANANGGDVTIGTVEGVGYPVFGRGIRTGGAL